MIFLYTYVFGDRLSTHKREMMEHSCDNIRISSFQKLFLTSQYSFEFSILKT